MEIIKTALIISIGIGSLFGFLRYVLEDKWNVLPQSLCKFCLSFWWIVLIEFCITGYQLIYQSIIPALISLPLAVVTAITIASFSYVYIKNAN